MDFEQLCLPHLNVLKRFLFHKISNQSDAEDILQDVLLSAYKGFDKLKDKNSFKSWLIGIASHKCADYYKAKAKKLEIPLDETSSYMIDRRGIKTPTLVNDTLNKLRGKDRQILYLFYIMGYNQKDIALKLGIPLGTVKSRVSTAKEKFKAAYPHHSKKKKGEPNMANKTLFPKFKPELVIEKTSGKPFSVKHEEIAHHFIIPRVGEKSSFAFYDDPDGRLSGISSLECVREAMIHDIPCIQVDVEDDDDGKISNETMFIRLTETHSSYLAEMRIENNSFYFNSFYDTEWLSLNGMGENNIGYEIYQEAKGIIRINDDGTIVADKEDCPDIIGRYKVKIGSRLFDTVALLDVGNKMMVIKYIDKNGRTVLFRRYNCFDWQFDSCKVLWTEKLPDSEVLVINGVKYVHWYDCISDYVLSGIVSN